MTSIANEAALELHGPGVWGKLTGIKPENLLNLVTVVLLAAIIALLVQADKSREAAHGAFQSAQTQVLANQAEILSRLKEDAAETLAITYVLTLTERERAALKLQMPKTLRARIQGP